MVLRTVYWFGVQGYEGIWSTLWARLCSRSTSILEIGGNIGLYSVLGGSRCPGPYVVLEPIPNVADQIRANLHLNRLERVEVVKAAAVPTEFEQAVQMRMPDEGTAIPVGSHLVNGTEVSGRTSGQLLTVVGLPFAKLAQGKDLIKIDAEGVEAVLLEAATDLISVHRPTLVVEVLPESVRLGHLLRNMAIDFGYHIYVIPGFGSDLPVLIPAPSFDSPVPGGQNSKDVILTILDLQELLK